MTRTVRNPGQPWQARIAAQALVRHLGLRATLTSENTAGVLRTLVRTVTTRNAADLADLARTRHPRATVTTCEIDLRPHVLIIWRTTP